MTSSSPVRRLSSIVDAVAASRGGLTLGEVASAVDLPPSTTHRTVNILLDVGYLQMEPATKTYTIGNRLKRVLLLSLGTGSLEELGRPALVALAEGFTETSYLVQLTGNGPELVDFHLPTRGPRTLVHPGFEFPLHATAAGKVIYAFQPEDAVEAELARGLERFTPSTMVTRSAVRAELARVRESGFAVSDEEMDAGVYAVAAPVPLGEGAVVGALAVVGIRERMLRNDPKRRIAAVVKETAADLSRLLRNTRLRGDGLGYPAAGGGG